MCRAPNVCLLEDVTGLYDRLCCRGVETQGQPWKAVDVDESMWCLEDDVEEAGETLKTLMISLIRPPPTESEITWKKGNSQL